MRKERKSNFEFLRIIAMFLIVTSHYAGWIEPEFQNTGISFNRILNQTLCFGGGAGNILFFLISGYFFGESSGNRKRIFTIWLEMFFYSVVCFFAAYVLTGNPGIRSLVAAVLPFSYGEYWFMTAYLMLMILMPWVGILINHMDCRNHGKLVFWLFVFSSVIPSIPGCPTTGIADVGFYLFVYLLGTYIRRYPNGYTESTKINLAAVLFSLSVMAVSVICFDILGQKYDFFAENARYFIRMRSPFVILWSVSFFNIFKKFNMKANKAVNYISGSVFAVYLIHANKNVRSYMWENIFKNADPFSPFLILHLLLAVLGIFIICMAVDVIRREVLEKPLLHLLDKRIKKE